MKVSNESLVIFPSQYMYSMQRPHANQVTAAHFDIPFCQTDNDDPAAKDLQMNIPALR